MNWTEQQTETRQRTTVTDAKAKEYDETKKSLPVVQREADGGVRPFKTVELQPIKGVDTFEAEFGVKDDDVIFHIWPWGYHDVERFNESREDAFKKRLPSFKDQFVGKLSTVFDEYFGAHKSELSYDGEMGAWFVRVRNGALNQFHRDLCIKAATALHTLMGGKV